MEAIALASHRSHEDVVREALEREIDRLQWEYRVVDQATDIRAGGAPTVTLSELNGLFAFWGVAGCG